MAETLVKNFTQISKFDTKIAGGKGASLGEMSQANIPVPDGFVILSDAFDKFFEETNLNAEIEIILDEVNIKEIHTVEHASEKIQAIILSKEIPEGIKTKVLKFYKNLDCEFVAVRSSATSEDSVSAAWAGQLDSFLNTPEEMLLENIKKCWASLFTSRAIFYRFEKKLDKEKISVAVVIQKMIESEESGIAFSVHPITQDKNHIIIEASFGLGEAIVSGSITPDSYVINKKGFKIVDISVNDQTRALYRKSEGWNSWKNLGEKGKKQVLSEKEIIELSKLVVKIENHYGFPCDIEWAKKNENFYIVQSRPITTLENRGATMHSHKDYKKRILSINWDLRVQRPGFLQAKQVVLEGICQKIYLTKNISIFHKNNIWIREANLYDQEMADISYESLFPKAFREDCLWILKIIKKLDDLGVQKDLFIKKCNEISWDTASEEEKIISLEEYAHLSKEISKYYSIAVPLTNYCEKVIREQDTSLLQYAAQYKALDFDIMNHSLLEIKKLRESNQDNAFYTAIEKHIQRYGWIKMNFSIREEYTKKDVLHELESDIHIFKPVDFPSDHPLYPFVVTLQSGIYLRNRQKESLQQLWYAYEQIIPGLKKDLSLSRRDFLQLSYREVIQSIKNKKVSVDPKEIKARHEWFITGVLNGKTITLTGPIVQELFNHFTEIKVDNILEIKGSVASPGNITEHVRIIHNISEIHKLKKGEVLVTSMTTPDFIVGMKKAGAIITDEGGLSCHAAIVSRELKIPCIIGTKIATKALKDGDLVEVDANQGIVRILKKKE